MTTASAAAQLSFMQPVRHLRSTLSAITCALLAAGATRSAADTMGLQAQLVKSTGFEMGYLYSKERHFTGNHGKVGLKNKAGNSASVETWREVIKKKETFTLTTTTRLKADAGARYGVADADELAALAQGWVSADQTFTLSKATPYRFVYTLAGSGELPEVVFQGGPVRVGVYRVEADGLRSVVKERFQRGDGAGVFSGTLPPGKYLAEALLMLYVQAGYSVRQDDLTASFGARFDLGSLSAAGTGWQKTLTKFSGRAVRLRAAANKLEGALRQQKKLVRVSSRNFPAAFDGAFTIVPKPGKTDSFSIVTSQEAGERIRLLAWVAGDAAAAGKDFNAIRPAFDNQVREAVEAGLLPHTALLHLEGALSLPSSGIVRELEWMSSIGKGGYLSGAQVTEMRARHAAAVQLLVDYVPVLRKRIKMLEGRQDFIVPALGTAAEELVREMKTDTRLTSREKEILRGGLDLADWTWRP